jgi:type IX secretion system PorP/SprF family membrane protein
MNKYVTLPLTIFTLSLGFALYAQDIHYSQMGASPLYINPAFTGNHECDFRAGVNYRQQDYYTQPYETYTAWGDTRFYPDFLHRSGWIGLGAHLYYDNSGTSPMEKIQAMLFTAYSQGFNIDNSIYASLGVGLGVTNRSFNKNNLIYEDQWNDQLLQFDPNLSSEDITQIKSSSIFYPDFNIGLSFHHLVNSEWMYEVGGSMSHVTKPRESFYGLVDQRVGRKMIAHATVQHILSDKLLIKPEVYYVSHMGSQELMIGSNLVRSFEDLKLYGGLWFRFGRDIIPTVGLEFNKLNLMFSYDVNVSKKRLASQYQGGFEISLTKKFCARKSTKREPCKMLLF